MATAPNTIPSIDRGVPIPASVNERKNYPFRDMEVGDSFAVAIVDRNTVAAAASYFGTRNGLKFSICKHGDAYRCWRVA